MWGTTLPLILVLAACGGPSRLTSTAATAVPDVSGLAWIGGDAFLAVHDAKVPGEAAWPRVSVLTLPAPGGPVRWQPLAVDWASTGRPSHDLESIARVPGTATYLLAESGDGGTAHQRIYVADLDGRRLTLREAVDWPVPVFDVEGTAVFRLRGRFHFAWAERAHGEPATRLVWAPLDLDPLRLGPVQGVAFQNPMSDTAATRPVSALEVDGEGRAWLASTFDPGDDGGPFRSAVWEVGQFESGSDGEARLQLLARPTLVATLDGLKVEALAARGHGDRAELVIGTDDEDFGGVVRRLPARVSGSEIPPR